MNTQPSHLQVRSKFGPHTNGGEVAHFLHIAKARGIRAGVLMTAGLNVSKFFPAQPSTKKAHTQTQTAGASEEERLSTLAAAWGKRPAADYSAAKANHPA